MKKFLLASLVLFSMSSFAQSFSYNSGYYYSQQSQVSNQCGYAYYNNFGRCVQTCRVAQWQSYYGTQWGYVQISNGYNYAWRYRQVTRNWWYYNWTTRTVFSNGCFY